MKFLWALVTATGASVILMIAGHYGGSHALLFLTVGSMLLAVLVVEAADESTEDGQTRPNEVNE